MRAEPLTAASFAPFGTLIRHGGGEGRHYLPEMLERRGVGALPAFWVNRLAPAGFPFAVSRLERHPFGAQSFAPLGQERMLVVVCSEGPDGMPDRATLRAFVTLPGTGVVYRPGTWHHGLVSIGAPMEVLVAMAAHGIDGETDLHELAEPVPVEEPSPT